MGDGDLAGVDVGVNGERHEIPQAIDGAAEKIKTGAEVGHGGRCEGLDCGQYEFGFP